MCLSALGQIIYGALMLVCLGLTLVSIFTPGWGRLNDDVKTDFKELKVPDNWGLWNFACTTPDNSDGSNQDCEDWWNNLPTWYKVVVVTMVIAAVLEIIALIWNLLTFCACCCKKHILHPLYGLAFFISIFLAIAIGVFYVKNKHILKDVDWDAIGHENFPDTNSEAGYSFFLACAALAASILAFIAGGIAACFADAHC